MKTWTYSWIVYPLVYCIASFFGLFHAKTRETLRLRSWKDFLSLRYNAGQPIEYWVHVASYGELEYAMPILKELQVRQKRVLVTYYSISAKKPVERLPKEFQNVSLVVPLPHDGLGLMKEFVTLVRKQGVRHLLLMKYELWPGLLWECNGGGISVLLVDALRPSWFHRRLLHKVNAILTGYEFEMIGVQHRNIQVVGDTRVERVLERIDQNNFKIDQICSTSLRNHLSASGTTLICGSMWPPDTQVLTEGIGKSSKKPNVFWVPHELDESQAKSAEERFKAIGYHVLSYDEAQGTEFANLKGKPIAVIVLKKGILVELYKLGRLAFVGGGFGKGIHSVWEPALAGARVACGPKTKRSPEAKELRKIGLLHEVTTADEVSGWLEKEWANQAEAAEELRGILKQHDGAAHRIVEICEASA